MLPHYKMTTLLGNIVLFHLFHFISREGQAIRSKHVEVRKQLGGGDSFHPPGDPAQIMRLGGKCPHPLSHLGNILKLSMPGDTRIIK